MLGGILLIAVCCSGAPTYAYDWCAICRVRCKPCHAAVGGGCQENSVAGAGTLLITSRRATTFGMTAVP